MAWQTMAAGGLCHSEFLRRIWNDKTRPSGASSNVSVSYRVEMLGGIGRRSIVHESHRSILVSPCLIYWLMLFDFRSICWQVRLTTCLPSARACVCV